MTPTVDREIQLRDPIGNRANWILNERWWIGNALRRLWGAWGFALASFATGRWTINGRVLLERPGCRRRREQMLLIDSVKLYWQLDRKRKLLWSTIVSTTLIFTNNYWQTLPLDIRYPWNVEVVGQPSVVWSWRSADEQDANTDTRNSCLNTLSLDKLCSDRYKNIYQRVCALWLHETSVF